MVTAHHQPLRNWDTTPWLGCDLFVQDLSCVLIKFIDQTFIILFTYFLCESERFAIIYELRGRIVQHLIVEYDLNRFWYFIKSYLLCKVIGYMWRISLKNDAGFAIIWSNFLLCDLFAPIIIGDRRHSCLLQNIRASEGHLMKTFLIFEFSTKSLKSGFGSFAAIYSN